jgi:hypothetical protein
VRWLVVVTLLAAGCTRPAAPAPAVDDRTDVWFLQHLVPHLRRTTVVVPLTTSGCEFAR